MVKYSVNPVAVDHLGLTGGATGDTKSRHACDASEERRLHRMGLIACRFRTAEWEHEDVELAGRERRHYLDESRS